MEQHSRRYKAGMRRASPMQQRFCVEYLKDLNGTRAAIRAGYSAKSAKVLANQLLNNPLLREEIARLKEKRNQCTKLDADWVLQRLRREVEADLIDIMNDDGSIRPMSDWPPIWRTGLVAGLEVTEFYGRDQNDRRIVVGVTKKIRFSDRLKRLELIGKHTDIGAFRERSLASDEDPLRRLYNQIAGHVIRPREEQEDNLDVPPNSASGDGTQH